MRGNEVSNEIKAKPPPDGTKNISCDFLHPSHYADAMVNLGKELKQED